MIILLPNEALRDAVQLGSEGEMQTYLQKHPEATKMDVLVGEVSAIQPQYVLKSATTVAAAGKKRGRPAKGKSKKNGKPAAGTTPARKPRGPSVPVPTDTEILMALADKSANRKDLAADLACPPSVLVKPLKRLRGEGKILGGRGRGGVMKIAADPAPATSGANAA